MPDVCVICIGYTHFYHNKVLRLRPLTIQNSLLFRPPFLSPKNVFHCIRASLLRPPSYKDHVLVV